MDSYLVLVLSTMVILVGLATLLHVQFGLTGIVNFGVVGFYGVGLYALGILMVDFGLPFVVALVATTLIVGLVGFVVGLVVLDLDDQAVLVATLAFATIAYYLVTTEKWLDEGRRGLRHDPVPVRPRRPDRARVPRPPRRAHRGPRRSSTPGASAASRTAGCSSGIRDNEGLARSLGKPTFRQKLVLFTVTSARHGPLRGAERLAQPLPRPVHARLPTLTFAAWIGLILGGKRHWAGALVGVLVIGVVFDIVIETVPPRSTDGARGDAAEREVHALRAAAGPRDHVPAAGHPRGVHAAAPRTGPMR